jgi:hypothetical protein
VLKKIFCIIVLLAAVCCSCRTAHCQDPGMNLRDWLKFAAGIAAGYGIHEGGHFLAAAATGTDLDWKLGKYNQPVAYEIHTDSEFKGEFVNSAGLRAQVISSEIILQVDDIDRNTPLIRGIMAWNVINPVLYALDYWFLHKSNYSDDAGFHGDIQGVEYYKGNARANLFAASMASLALYQGYRFLKTQDWAPEWMRDPNEESQRLSLLPLPNKTFALADTINF